MKYVQNLLESEKRESKSDDHQWTYKCIYNHYTLIDAGGFPLLGSISTALHKKNTKNEEFSKNVCLNGIQFEESDEKKE